jgi:hypothetical protein
MRPSTLPAIDGPTPSSSWSGDVALRELDLQQRAVMRGAEEHGLLLELRARLAALQDRRHDALSLRRVILHRDEAGPFTRYPVRVQVLGEAFAGEADHRVRCCEDRLRGAVILLQCDDPGWRRKLRGKIQDVAHAGGPEAVDGLSVIAHDHETGAVRLQSLQDCGLQRVGILVFIY